MAEKKSKIKSSQQQQQQQNKKNRSKAVSLKTCNPLANPAHLPDPGTVQGCGGELILETKGLILRILIASFP